MSTKEERKQEAERRLVEVLRREPLGFLSYALTGGGSKDTRQPSTFTYFIRMDEPGWVVGESLGPGGPVKIGCASDPEARLLQLQTGSPYPLRLLGYVPGGEKLERELHKKYAHLHMQGEWFRATLEFEHEIYEMIFDYQDGEL